jgi:O-antigen/teichoic acid export membrane protein
MQSQITKDMLTYLPGKALPALAAFITVPIYTRLFSPAEFGNYVLAVAAAEFLVLGTATGFGQAAVRFFSAYQLRSSLSNYFAVVLGSVGLITLVGTAVSTTILLIIRTLIPAGLYALLWAAVALFNASVIFSTLIDVLRGQEKSRWYSTFFIASHYGGILFGLVLVLVFKMGIRGLIWGQTLSLLLLITPLIWLTTRSITIHPAHFNRIDFKQLWAFALPFTIGNTAFWSLSLADRYIISIFRGSFDVGLYSVATKISWRSVQLLASLFFLVPAPMISRLWEERGRQAAEEALTAFTRIFYLMIIPSVIGLSVLAAPLVRLLADEAFYGGYTAIWLVAIGSMGLALSDLGSSGCLVANRTRLIARNQCLAAAAGLILNFILVPFLGFMGAALSAAIAFGFLAFLQAISSARFLTWRWPWRSLWRVLIASAAMCAVVLLLQAVIRADTTLWLTISLLLSILGGALTYGLALWVLGEITPRNLPGFFSAGQRQLAIEPVAGETEKKL